MPHTAHIGIGSNLGSPGKNCLAAMERMDAHESIAIISRSSLYETEPFGKTDQNRFVNAVVQIETALTPVKLLEALLKIEQDMGRVRNEKWGPRIMDLDILFYEDRIVQEKTLEIPHPGIPERSFVLIPMKEIAGDFVHPQLKKTIHALCEPLADPEKVRRLSESR